MQEKYIKKHLARKLEDFAKSINDERLRKLVLRDTFITGGAITSLLMDERLNDYDIYIENMDTAMQLTEYYVNKYFSGYNIKVMARSAAKEHKSGIVQDENDDGIYVFIKSSGVIGDSDTEDEEEVEKVRVDEAELERTLDSVKLKDIPEGEKYVPLMITSNAITLSDKVQLIIRFVGKPEEVHKNFDYVHCTCWYKYNTGELHLPQEALTSLITKQLRYIGSRYPVASLFRVRKFIKRGWSINAGEMLKIIYQSSELDLNDFDVLRDQLVGVDMTYFAMVLSALAKVAAKGENGSARLDCDQSYLFTVIDRVFN